MSDDIYPPGKSRQTDGESLEMYDYHSRRVSHGITPICDKIGLRALDPTCEGSAEKEELGVCVHSDSGQRKESEARLQTLQSACVASCDAGPGSRPRPPFPQFSELTCRLSRMPHGRHVSRLATGRKNRDKL